MAREKSIEEIIREECLPLGDCMLTVTDAHGEVGFLYFKEGELIEANYSALWGKDALAEIVNWKLNGQTIAPLPLGIKRSLWDKLEFLLNPGLVPTLSGKLPAAPARPSRSAAASPFNRFKSIPHLLKLIYLDAESESIILDASLGNAEIEQTEWLREFAGQVKAVGDTLGFGSCEKWVVATENYEIVGLSHDTSFITLIRGRDAAEEDLESVVNKLIDEG